MRAWTHTLTHARTHAHTWHRVDNYTMNFIGLCGLCPQEALSTWQGRGCTRGCCVVNITLQPLGEGRDSCKGWGQGEQRETHNWDVECRLRWGETCTGWTEKQTSLSPESTPKCLDLTPAGWDLHWLNVIFIWPCDKHPLFHFTSTAPYCHKKMKNWEILHPIWF